MSTTVDFMLETLDSADVPASTTWTTGNVAEAFPGVFSAFGISFVFGPMEMAFRRMFHDLGAYPASEVRVPDDVGDCFWSLFAGWGAGNIDKFREVANVLPGTSATAIELQLFGYVRPDTVDANTAARYPAIVAKAPRWVIGVPKRHDRMFAELRRWRLSQLPRISSLDEAGCLAVLADARTRFEDIMSIHMGVAFISSALADKVAEAASAAGMEGLEQHLLSGVGSDENEVAYDLWALAHGKISEQEFIDRHGYHGPNEGQLYGITWRENMAPIRSRLADYRAIDSDNPRAPQHRSAAQRQLRDDALARLLAVTPRLRKRPTAWIVSVAARFLALREQGKAGYLITYDVARAAARRLGDILVERGVIDDREHVFHLRYDALVAGISGDPRDVVAERIDQFNRRQAIRIPRAWAGYPSVMKVDENSGDALGIGDVVTGVAASAGQVEGRARVVRDPAGTELDDGDILVCETTDPSWVSLFMVAGGVVTDFGGLLSHGPIVAREIGIPCVCGTETGSRKIQDGQTLRVDGDTGEVTVIG
ncbi:PEP-utilizing enzyme [Gordonia westfalica]|uniref:PEP-utilizing enzyme n=1 Tax=Gordonia westfalica TaxID=158898 RepID=A0ABU2GTQ3_9ACTN|nr:PEP-utilizing enzyme [Gordonia westfalica]MDS1114828.1 PEP-utilizing enzyme [Gordonia westfalica]